MAPTDAGGGARGRPGRPGHAAAAGAPPRCARSAPHLAAGAVLTDVGTLKRPVLDDRPRRPCPRARFVGGHPLAGTEESGLGRRRPAAVPRRAVGADPRATTPTSRPGWRVAELVCDLGAKPVPTTADEQDAAVARVIGLPHVLAEALALTGLAGGPLGLSLAAGSYLSGSRVARTRPGARGDLVRRQPGARRRARRRHRPAAARPATRWPRTARCCRWPRPATGARIDWEHRRFEPVELAADAAELLRARPRRRVDHRGPARAGSGPAARDAPAD